MKRRTPVNTNPTADRGGLRWQKHPQNQLNTDAKKRRESLGNDADPVEKNRKKALKKKPQIK